MEVVHTCPDVRYWSEVLCCTIPTHMSEFGGQCHGLRKKFTFLVKASRGKARFRQAMLSFCVEVLWPSQPNGVMLSAVSLPNHMFTGQA